MKPITTIPSLGTTDRRRAFTLIELLVVIAVIVILLSILLAVSARVFSGQKAASTRNVLTTLDRVLDEYITATGTIPRYRPRDWRFRPSQYVGLQSGPLGSQPTGEEDYLGNDHVRRPEVSVFLDQVTGYGAADDLLQGIPPQFLRTFTLSGVVASETEGRVKRTVVDAWATGDEWGFGPENNRRYPMAGEGSQPLIYYIHPDNALAQDLYGRCVAGRPYFLSPGPDGRYGLGGGVEIAAGAPADEVHRGLNDNITSYPVGPANLSTLFFNQTRDQTR